MLYSPLLITVHMCSREDEIVNNYHLHNIAMIHSSSINCPLCYFFLHHRINHPLFSSSYQPHNLHNPVQKEKTCDLIVFKRLLVSAKVVFALNLITSPSLFITFSNHHYQIYNDVINYYETSSLFTDP